MQCCALILAAYKYEISYKASAQHGNADALSRLALKETGPSSNPMFRVSFLEVLPVSAAEVASNTAKDPLLSKVKYYTLNGWPIFVKEEDLKPYANKCTELSVENDCVHWGLRVVIPKKLQVTMFMELHRNNLGMVKMKAIAQSHFWWPGLDKQIEAVVNACQTCQTNRSLPGKAPIHPWRWAERPWQRIHVDFWRNFLCVARCLL